MNNRNWIPIPYQVILKRLELDSLDDELGMGRVRQLLINTCRIPKNLATPLLLEMQKLGWVIISKFKLTIVKKVECEILPRKKVWEAYNNRFD